jgi:hypothetical protein
MRCVAVVGSIVPGGMRALLTISIRGLCVWPCVPLVLQGRLRRALRIRSDVPVICRDRTVNAARVGDRECAFHAVLAGETKCTPTARRTEVRQVVPCTALCGACAHDERVGAIVVRASA